MLLFITIFVFKFTTLSPYMLTQNSSDKNAKISSISEYL